MLYYIICTRGSRLKATAQNKKKIKYIEVLATGVRQVPLPNTTHGSLVNVMCAYRAVRFTAEALCSFEVQSDFSTLRLFRVVLVWWRGLGKCDTWYN